MMRHVKRALLVGAIVFALIWAFALTSEPYRLSVKAMENEQLVKRVGERRFRLLSAFTISHSEGQPSTLRFFVWGSRQSGTLRLDFRTENGAFLLTHSTFNGEPVDLATQ